MPDDGYGNTFILTGTSEHLTMKTPQPPGAPSNLGIVATTCHSMQIAWDPPHETGVDIIGKELALFICDIFFTFDNFEHYK